MSMTPTGTPTGVSTTADLHFSELARLSIQQHALVAVADTSTAKTRKALDDSVAFTTVASYILLPKCSLFYQGAKLLRSKDDRYGIDTFLGVLVLMAAPVGEVLRIGGGVLGTVGGTLAMAATGTAHGVDLLAHKASEAAKPSAKKVPVSEAFVNRMRELLESSEVSADLKEHFRKNPGQLVSLTAVTIAFLSRAQEKGTLVGSKGQVVTEKEAKKLSKEHNEDFQDICAMKEAIKDLNLSQHDGHAWRTLMEMMGKTHDSSETVETKELQPHTLECLKTLTMRADSFSTKVVEDPLFQTLWNI